VSPVEIKTASTAEQSAALAGAQNSGPRREIVRCGGAEMAVFHVDGESAGPAPLLIWAHGWGHTHRAFLPLAESVRRTASSILVDFPGFGASPPPPGPWGTADYADAVAEWLTTLPAGRRIWIGHSFGCRVGLRLAARHADAVQGLFLVAAAGLPPQRSAAARVRMAARRWVFRIMRSLTPEGPARDRLRERFGSADYRQAGAMRPVLVKTVSENLSDVARAVRCPVALVYGENDRETPPEIGERLQRLIPNAQLHVLRGFDHWNVLTEGQHQLTHRLTEFLEHLS
jgi:pimeloyl-ACP methyl ester carboxylesterase